MNPLPQASTQAGRTDAIFFVLCGIAGVVLLLLLALVIGFAFAYRRGSKTPRPPLGALVSREVEIGWTVATAFAFLFIFWWAAGAQLSSLAAPPEAMEIHVVAKQWMWKYQHPGGAREINDLHVPAMTPVRLEMISQDAIHSFSVPAFRIKHDVLPGRYSETWFEATTPGVYRIACMEYCGANHAAMTGFVIVMTQADYVRWISTQAPGGDLATHGRQLYAGLGCSTCHDGGGPAPAPQLTGLYGRAVPLERGPPRTADETYLREAILAPNAAIVAGYQAGMPAYQGIVAEEDVVALIAFIKSLGEERIP
jgi:cytochrome c oxidase subunit 2